MLMIEPGPALADLAPSWNRTDRDGRVRFVGSGKAGLRLIFAYLQRNGILPHKMTPAIVPAWLGTWVYAEMLPYAFPVVSSPDARVAMCYHQYGFPQDMARVRDITHSRKLLLIEDCAHACASRYKGTVVGEIGDFAVWSFSKFTFCFALGGVAANDPAFDTYVSEVLRTSSSGLRLLSSAIKLITEADAHRDRPLAPQFTNGLMKMAYARYGDQTAPGACGVALWLAKRDHELAARRTNYALLRREGARWGVCDHLESEADVIPYAVPLMIRANSTSTLAGRLREAGIDAGIRRFDFARCIFEPDYRECVLVPIHSKMAGSGMEKLIAALTATLS